MKRATLAAATAGSLGAFAYERWGKPWQQAWGATPDELATPLPGDDLVAEPALQITRAATIDAELDAVWPWLVQLGADRGGFYSYDWLENLFGLGIHSAREVVPEWQDLAIGDVVYANRARSGGWFVVDLLPNRALVLKVADLAAGRPVRRDQPPHWEFVWTFALSPATPSGTRLLVRERTAFAHARTRLLLAPVGLASFVMTRRMMLGIKARAERPSTRSTGNA
jgi:hypothetical protein